MELRLPRPEDEASFRAAVAAFEVANPDWDFAFDWDADADFAAYCAKIASWEDKPPPGWVRGSYWVGVVGGIVVGRMSFRHELNDFLLQIGGHLGYGVVPRYRRHGYAKQMLQLSLPRARELGMPRVLLTCDDDNVGSIHTIEGCGGVLENTVENKRRYWIELT